ncbi:MAG: hypothetical protein COT81_00885 [Candidatus Buchananbacteria bacterium CG10_big_fil_rev_8_21_14_0_10_42_9]|uniref:Uncharacterized protein n=1 Tax=Candidatus Buchananbacteria bacterium CG10_big_fil_rev_8_21_14_0_10_42_9 TaxID=1974526 RepID=A0A2H0W2E8_9BACT|nr:MAG: hypothetical protein COT81_00885 [Candidatus Buchananbacteria bacterium CG10_big_fil_rev_8_21_14_0_10_42_9]
MPASGIGNHNNDCSWVAGLEEARRAQPYPRGACPGCPMFIADIEMSRGVHLAGCFIGEIVEDFGERDLLSLFHVSKGGFGQTIFRACISSLVRDVSLLHELDSCSHRDWKCVLFVLHTISVKYGYEFKKDRKKAVLIIPAGKLEEAVDLCTTPV